MIEEFKFVLSGADTKPMRYRSQSRKSSVDTQDLTGISDGSDGSGQDRDEPLPYGFSVLLGSKKSQLDVFRPTEDHTPSNRSQTNGNDKSSKTNH